MQRKIMKHTLSEHLHMHFRRQPIVITDQIFELQHACIVLHIANIRVIIDQMQDDDNTDREELSDEDSDDAGDSIVSSDSDEDNLDNQQEVLHYDQARCDMVIQSTRLPLPKKCNGADSVSARSSLSNLRYPAGAMPLPLLKCQRSTINIFCESDILAAMALRLPKAGGDHSVLQQKAGEDHNISNTKRLSLK
jgi:hypothetical protein